MAGMLQLLQVGNTSSEVTMRILGILPLLLMFFVPPLLIAWALWSVLKIKKVIFRIAIYLAVCVVMVVCFFAVFPIHFQM
jgi:hypothetical protein